MESLGDEDVLRGPQELAAPRPPRQAGSAPGGLSGRTWGLHVPGDVTGRFRSGLAGRRALRRDMTVHALSWLWP
jgi:hypothetical protein